MNMIVVVVVIVRMRVRGRIMCVFMAVGCAGGNRRLMGMLVGMRNRIVGVGMRMIGHGCLLVGCGLIVWTRCVGDGRGLTSRQTQADRCIAAPGCIWEEPEAKTPLPFKFWLMLQLPIAVAKRAGVSSAIAFFLVALAQT
jgi:hypothetical protein